MASKDASDREAEEAEAVDGGGEEGPKKIIDPELGELTQSEAMGLAKLKGAAALRVWKKNLKEKKPLRRQQSWLKPLKSKSAARKRRRLGSSHGKEKEGGGCSHNTSTVALTMSKEGALFW